jgi:hypothetical protein
MAVTVVCDESLASSVGNQSTVHFFHVEIRLWRKIPNFTPRWNPTLIAKCAMNGAPGYLLIDGQRGRGRNGRACVSGNELIGARGFATVSRAVDASRAACGTG